MPIPVVITHRPRQAAAASRPASAARCRARKARNQEKSKLVAGGRAGLGRKTQRLDRGGPGVPPGVLVPQLRDFDLDVCPPLLHRGRGSPIAPRAQAADRMAQRSSKPSRARQRCKPSPAQRARTSGAQMGQVALPPRLRPCPWRARSPDEVSRDSGWKAGGGNRTRIISLEG